MRIAMLAAALCLMCATWGPPRVTKRQTQDAHGGHRGHALPPEVLTVAPGDTIEWVNKDLVPHTATSRAGGFDSKDHSGRRVLASTPCEPTGDFAYSLHIPSDDEGDVACRVVLGAARISISVEGVALPQIVAGGFMLTRFSFSLGALGSLLAALWFTAAPRRAPSRLLFEAATISSTP